MDLSRFLQVFVVQGFIGFFFLFIGLKVLKRETKGLNLILSLFYFLSALGVIINIIYVNIFVEDIVRFLHFLTYFTLCLSLIFLLLFVLLLYKSDRIITLKVQLAILMIFSGFLISMWFIPGGIVINETTSWKPDWSWPFFIYSVIVCSSLAIIPTIYFSFKIYSSFKHDILKKRWKYFIIGILVYFFLYYGTSLSNTLADPTFRLIWSLISLISLVSLYFIFYGVAKQL
jgi:hypothetical protein